MLGFFNNGLTIASLTGLGTMPDCKDVFNIVKTLAVESGTAEVLYHLSKLFLSDNRE